MNRSYGALALLLLLSRTLAEANEVHFNPCGEDLQCTGAGERCCMLGPPPAPPTGSCCVPKDCVMKVTIAGPFSTCKDRRTTAIPSPTTVEMNGAYLISDPATGKHRPSAPFAHRGKYIDVYSFNISTRYSEVYWTMQPPVPLPPSFVAEFDGKPVVITGYEVDSVRTVRRAVPLTGVNGEEEYEEYEEESVPITQQYNHHHNAYVLGKSATMVNVGPAGSKKVPRHGGLPSRWEPRTVVDPSSSNTSPAASAASPQVATAAFIVDGNGGEYRQSLHATAAGYVEETTTNA